MDTKRRFSRAALLGNNTERLHLVWPFTVNGLQFSVNINKELAETISVSFEGMSLDNFFRLAVYIYNYFRNGRDCVMKDQMLRASVSIPKNREP